MTTDRKWDFRFLDLAGVVARWSKDPSTKVGAVIVDQHRRAAISMGYNGFPRNIEDSEPRLRVRLTRLALTVHAECNAIYNAAAFGTRIEGMTMYIYGLPPCRECAKAIIQAGLRRVVCVYSLNEVPAKWARSCRNAQKILTEAGCCVTFG